MQCYLPVKEQIKKENPLAITAKRFLLGVGQIVVTELSGCSVPSNNSSLQGCAINVFQLILHICVYEQK